MREPAVEARYAQGPVECMILSRPGTPAIGRNLLLMFAYHLVVSTFVTYLAAHTLPPGRRT